VNVGANALTWLRRLTLAGRDLPDLYNKVRDKMLVYQVERKASVRALVVELGKLGAQLGTNIKLNETETSYFLLLGQSLAVKVMPSKKKSQKENTDA
jgi:CRISPR-associated protein Csh1